MSHSSSPSALPAEPENGALSLPECLILLALNDQTGKRNGHYVDIALAGAGLSELALRGLLREQQSANRFTLAADIVTGDAFLDGCMNVVRDHGVDKPPKQLISKIAGTKGLVERLLDRLVSRGILQQQTKKLFFIFDQKVYPEAAPEPERHLKAHLADIMFSGGVPTSRDCVLIALAKQTGLLNVNFDRALLREHHAHIDDIARGKTLAASATAETISAIQTAILIAVIVPVVIT